MKTETKQEKIRKGLLRFANENYVLKPDGWTDQDCMVDDMLNYLHSEGTVIQSQYTRPNCLQCGVELRKVTPSPGSPLNQDQFDSIKAGDWYCADCKGDEAKGTAYKYWWNRELQYTKPWVALVEPLITE